MPTDAITRIAVVGAGLMGHGIAQDFALAGYPVSLHDIGDDRLRQALASIRTNLHALATIGRVTPAQVASVPAAIRTTTVLRDAVAEADVVIEAVLEDLALKQRVFAELDRLCPPHTLLASNTSSFLPSSYAAATQRPEKVLGAHYFNPPYLIPLVELIRSAATSEETVTAMYDLLITVGKQPIVEQKEVPGFVANRLQAALLQEALWLVQHGVATPQDVDRAITTSIGRRWAVAGVFEVFDLNGWDTVSAVYAQVIPHLEATSAVLTLLHEKVARGELGVKAGKGFYDWTPEAVEEMKERISHALAAIAQWNGSDPLRGGPV